MRHTLRRLLLSALLLVTGAAHAQPTTKAAMPDLDTLELSTLEWSVDYGEELPADAVPHPWRGQSLYYASHHRLSIHLGEGAHRLTWDGTPEQEEIQQTKALLMRLLREHAQTPWPGSMEKRAFDDLKKEKKKRLCVWELHATFTEPGGRDTVREIRLLGSDTGTNPARLAFEVPLAEHAEKLARHLQANAPKALKNLDYTSKGEGGAYYALSADSYEPVSLSRQRSGQDKESSEVAPALATRVADIVRKHGADGWHGFAAPEWKRDAPGTFELSMRYDTGQQVWARGLRGQAAPEGHAAFERELLAAFDEVLDGPPGTPRAAPRQGLKNLYFSVTGMFPDFLIAYHVRSRREAGRDVFRLMHKRGHQVSGCPMSDEDVAALEALLARLEVSGWNGFKGDDPDVLDGTAFDLSLAYTDGREVSARGSNSFPRNYLAARDALITFFDALLAKHPSKNAPE